MSGFKHSTIKAVIRNKLDKWMASVDDPALVSLIQQDVLVTGGCIASMCLGEKINDYDIYFRTYETAKAVAEYYVAKFNDAKTGELTVEYTPQVKEEIRKNIKGEEERRIVLYMKSAGVAGENQTDYKYYESESEEVQADFMASLVEEADPVALTEGLLQQVKDVKHDYRPLFLTDNAISLTDKVQIIIRFFGSPEEIHRNFDFVHCQGIYEYQGNQLHLSQETMTSLLSKQLIYSGSLYPVATVFRLRKFLKRGWNISAGQILKICSQMSHIDWSSPEMLKEQLTGVDVAYMHQLIAALQNRDKGQRIDTTYLAALIDTIFDD